MVPEIHPAALKNGLSEDEILHVYANPFRTFTQQGDWELTMHVGFGLNGVTLTEVGFATAGDGQVLIVHAMRVGKQRAKQKYNL